MKCGYLVYVYFYHRPQMFVICSLPSVMGNVTCQLNRFWDCLGDKPLEKPVEHCLLDYG